MNTDHSHHRQIGGYLNVECTVEPLTDKEDNLTDQENASGWQKKSKSFFKKSNGGGR